MKSKLDSLLDKLEENPYDAATLYQIALQYLITNNDEEAENYLKEVIEIDPEFVPAYVRYANLKVNLNEIEEAKVLYKKGISAARKNNDLKSIREMEDYLDELEQE